MTKCYTCDCLFLWNEYGVEDDSKLGVNARKLKQEIIESHQENGSVMDCTCECHKEFESCQ